MNKSSFGCFLLCLALALPATAAAPLVEASPANGKGKNAGFLYAQVTLMNSKVYEGRVRFDDEEASWGDYFNSTKEPPAFLRDAPNQGGERYPVKVFGIPLFNHNESWGRQFVVRFGDIDRIEVSGGGRAAVYLKGGLELEIRGGSNDLSGEIVVWDEKEGETRIDWRKLRTLQFKASPPNLAVAEKRFYGKLETTTGVLQGFIQWDQEECLSTDVLSGDSNGKDRDVEIGELKAIEKKGGGSRFVFRDGHEEILTGTNDVDGDNRGIWVDDPRYGRVMVNWKAFVRLDVLDPPNAGPGYGEFAPTKALVGKVTMKDGKVHEGQVIYDLDETYGWEMLNGDAGELEYSIPFEMVASVRPGADFSDVVLKNGEKLRLDGSQDVGEINAGLLVGNETGKRVYVPWKDVESVELQ